MGLLSAVDLDVLTWGLWPSCWKGDADCGFELRCESIGKTCEACKGLLASIRADVSRLRKKVIHFSESMRIGKCCPHGRTISS